MPDKHIFLKRLPNKKIFSVSYLLLKNDHTGQEMRFLSFLEIVFFQNVAILKEVLHLICDKKVYIHSCKRLSAPKNAHLMVPKRLT